MRLARRWHWTWVDSDNEIEQQTGRSIRSIFAEDGEPEFRRIEREVLTDLIRRDKQVLSTGGGAILNADTRADLRVHGPVIWLKASVETIASRILGDSTTLSRRPNLTPQGGIDEIRQILAVREPLYAASATWTIETDGLTLPEVVRRIDDQYPTTPQREATP